MEKELSTIRDLVENESIEFKRHPTVKGTLQAKLMFDNGFGLLIMTNGNTKDGLIYGDWNQNIYEVALLKKIDEDDFDLVLPEEVEDELSLIDPDFEDFKSFYGVWNYINQNKVIEKINIIKNL